MANIPLKSIKFPDLPDTYIINPTIAEVDGLQNALDGKADKTDVYNGFVSENIQGSIASFDDGADDIPVKSLIAEIVPVQSGSGDPSPDNVRAISGWNGCNVSVAGKNLFDGSSVSTTATSNWGVTWENGELIIEHKNAYSTGVPSTPYMKLPQGSYCLSWTSSSVVVIDLYINGSFQRALNSGDSFTVTNGDTVALKFVNGNPGTITYSAIQLELGSTATTYEPYNGEVYTISFASAGTVYGGSIDVTTGVLTVDRRIITLAPYTSNISYNTTYMGFYLPAWALTAPNANPDYISDKYKSVGDYTNLVNNSIAHIFGKDMIIRDERYTDVATFIANEGDTQVCYRLANPTTYQLTPTEVKTLLGNNNVWADTGDIDLTYRADLGLYLDKIINA